MDPLLAGYITFTFILAVTPGSTTAVVVRNTLAAGRLAGFACAAGAAVGNTTQATVAGLGLAVLFARFPSALVVLRVLGAGYLAWLGASGIWSVLMNRDGRLPLSSDASSGTPVGNARTSLRQGLTVNLLNPTVSTFYLVVVPTFLPAGAPRWYYPFLASIHITIALLCHAAWALAFDSLRQVFKVTAARRTLEVATGLALIGLAVRVLI